MSLLDYFDEKTIEQIEDIGTTILENKHSDMQKFVDTAPSVKAQAEMEIFKPKKLEKITFQKAETEFGKRIKISLFVTNEEFKKLKNKWKIIEQFEENRIASSDINKFINKILE